MSNEEKKERNKAIISEFRMKLGKLATMEIYFYLAKLFNLSIRQIRKIIEKRNKTNY